MQLISASRRTDIPRYYARWFEARRRAGFVRFKNSFGGAGEVSLRVDDVLGYVFWTRDARPFAAALRALRDETVPYAVQYTINGFGRELEPHVPSPERTLADFVEIAAALPRAVAMPAPAAIQWRYDPIVISAAQPASWHVDNFGRLARALAGATRVVNTSIVEPYLKAVRRVADPSVRFRAVDPQRHRAVSRLDPPPAVAGDDARELLATLSAIAAEHGMQLRACANPEWGLPPSQCIGAELFSGHAPAITERVAAIARAPSRGACRCIKAIDIGMDNSCAAGCRYCYVISSQALAQKNLAAHDPDAPSLR